ncbi:oligosaccharide flippase family protein [uncultured Ruminococcus sp.]|uniref:lipopolysaccharide biosynthesis protein n=1 Tax=uncultured Ruminococcus sp. TaxID=165186 RepID=UPI0025D0549D|nr:oligosaccharide flippase family protein [uncultured Ruminococcus sp.]
MKASFVYTISSVLSKGLAVITIPVFTRIMNTEQMGIVNLFTSWQAMIGVFATLSLTSGGYMLAMKEFEKRRDKYMSSVLTLTSITALIIALIYYSGRAFFNNFIGLSSNLMILMIFGFFVSPATEFWLARQRYEYNYIRAGLITIISSLLATLFSIICVLLGRNKGYDNLAEIRLFSTNIVVFGIALIIWIAIMVKGKTFVDTFFWRYSLKLSVPLIGNSIAMQILSVSDRSMISKMVGNSELGIYSVLYSVSSLSIIVWSAINSSFVPFLFEKIEKKEGRRKIQSVSTKLMFVYGFFAVLATAVAPEIVRILATKEYYEAIYIMPPIAAGIFFTSVSNIYSNILIYYKKTQYIMISSILAAVINLVLNYLFIQIWGYMAAAYTTLIAYVVLAIMQLIVSNSVIKKQKNFIDTDVYDHKSIIIISIITVTLCMSCLAIYHLNNIYRYIITAVFGILVGLLYLKVYCSKSICKKA